MDAFEAIRSKLDIREFSTKDVPQEIKSNVLEAARLTRTGLNTQHWRFILVEIGFYRTCSWQHGIPTFLSGPAIL